MTSKMRSDLRQLRFHLMQMTTDSTQTKHLMLVCQIHEIAKYGPDRTAVIRNGVPIDYFTFSNLIQWTISLLKLKRLPAEKLAIIPASDQLIEWLLVLSLRWLGLNTIVVKSLKQAIELELVDCACIVTPDSYVVTSEERSKFPVEMQFVTIPSKYWQNSEQTLLPLQPLPHSFGGHIVYTSGTTGIYKKVLYEGKYQYERDYQRAKLQSFSEDTVLHNLYYGLWTGAGFRNPTAVWISGGAVVLDRRPDWHKHFLSYRANVVYFTPQILRELLMSECKFAFPSADLTLHVTGGHLSLALAEEANRQLTSDLRIHYAATEVQGPVLRSNYRSAADLFWLEPVLGARIQIVDTNGTECAIGDEGELRILLDNIDSCCYVDDQASSAKVFRSGFFYPGDLAIKRIDGRIRILGRTDDVLNIQGTKTAVAPIEQWIQTLLGADEVCVFSWLSDNGDDVLLVAIEAQEEVAKSDVETISTKFSQFTKISMVTCKTFPRTEGGMEKVNRRKLKNHVIDEMRKQGI